MTVNTTRYYIRKAKGVCVRCELPTSGTSVLCEAHLNYSRSRRKAKAPDDAPWAINSAVEPPREPYKSESLPAMPPVPRRCSKCGGCWHIGPTEWGEPDMVKCINCGFVLCPSAIPLTPEECKRKNQHGKTGPQLPVVVRV